MVKSFYRLNLVLQSPLSIGSGTGELTDSDVFRNSFGEPAIPASAIAGMLRAKFENANRLFGTINNGNNEESKILTYDAEVKGNYHVTVRDSVKLTEGKTAQKGAKFDFEAVEAGTEFVTYIEASGLSDAEQDEFETALLSSDVFTMGKKSTRGYGVICVTDIRKKCFCLDSVEGYSSYLDFRMFADAAFGDNDKIDLTPKTDCNRTVIELHLLVKGSPMIRKYFTEPSRSKTEAAPDFSQLTTKGNERDIPVIPGTSWAGAFRSHMLKLGIEMGKEKEALYIVLKDSFGYVSNKESLKSKVIFSETQITPIDENSQLCDKVITRTAIDRFSGGSADRSLFTQRAFFGGKTVLKIIVNGSVDDLFFILIATAIKDLDMGIMSVGGQTSVGHGLFNVEKIYVNGNDVELQKDDFIISDAASLLKGEVIENVL